MNKRVFGLALGLLFTGACDGGNATGDGDGDGDTAVGDGDGDASGDGDTGDGDGDGDGPVGLSILGGGSHSVDDINIEALSGWMDGLNGPRDLAFNPYNPGELWVVNEFDDSTVTYHNVGSANQEALKIIDPYAFHFMEIPSSIAFADDNTFATCQESRNTYNDQAAPNDFMGPALWSADLDIYGISNPEAVQGLGFDLGSHLDMLHESPLCMGIAWDQGNSYWTFEGLTGTIGRSDFAADHGVGWDDHSDGIMERYVDARVSRVAGVPSHLVFDQEQQLLYVADTGNSRIAVLDPSAASRGTSMPVVEPGTQLWTMTGGNFSTFISAEDGELERPSGLALHDGVLYVTDNATGRISAFDAASGERIDYVDLDVQDGALMGIEVNDDGIFFVNYRSHSLWMITE